LESQIHDAQGFSHRVALDLSLDFVRIAELDVLSGFQQVDPLNLILKMSFMGHPSEQH
jgi:hypothetical protein